jgi:hypothetical protein
MLDIFIKRVLPLHHIFKAKLLLALVVVLIVVGLLGIILRKQ